MAVIRSTETVNGHDVAVLIEVDRAPGEDYGAIYGETRGAEKVMESARNVFRDGLDLARKCAAQVVDTVTEIHEDHRPNDFQIQLAIKLDAEVGAFLVKSTAGAQMQVTMSWKKA